MKAISVHQPSASLWLSPRKLHETRSWPTTHIGRLAVHAAKRPIGRDLDDRLASMLRRDIGPDWADVLPFGAIIGVVDIVGCFSTDDVMEHLFNGVHANSTISTLSGPVRLGDDYACGDFTAGRYAWRRERYWRLAKPVPWTGRQGLFDVPDDILPRAAR